MWLGCNRLYAAGAQQHECGQVATAFTCRPDVIEATVPRRENIPEDVAPGFVLVSSNSNNSSRRTRSSR
eukprot:8643812-Pyramimonas_sp.AAC.1